VFDPALLGSPSNPMIPVHVVTDKSQVNIRSRSQERSRDTQRARCQGIWRWKPHPAWPGLVKGPASRPTVHLPRTRIGVPEPGALRGRRLPLLQRHARRRPRRPGCRESGNRGHRGDRGGWAGRRLIPLAPANWPAGLRGCTVVGGDNTPLPPCRSGRRIRRGRDSGIWGTLADVAAGVPPRGAAHTVGAMHSIANHSMPRSISMATTPGQPWFRPGMHRPRSRAAWMRGRARQSHIHCGLCEMSARMQRSGPRRDVPGLPRPYEPAVPACSRSHCRPLSVISQMLRGVCCPVTAPG
jgi:hypothetical protein